MAKTVIYENCGEEMISWKIYIPGEELQLSLWRMWL